MSPTALEDFSSHLTSTENAHHVGLLRVTSLSTLPLLGSYQAGVICPSTFRVLACEDAHHLSGRLFSKITSLERQPTRD